jgi:antitoxin component of RelBE/YafQ-DinJ toxin-antitoxin module
MFYRQAALQQGLPFTVNIPNRETLEALIYQLTQNELRLVHTGSYSDLF